MRNVLWGAAPVDLFCGGRQFATATPPALLPSHWRVPGSAGRRIDGDRGAKAVPKYPTSSVDDTLSLCRTPTARQGPETPPRKAPPTAMGSGKFSTQRLDWDRSQGENLRGANANVRGVDLSDPNGRSAMRPRRPEEREWYTMNRRSDEDTEHVFGALHYLKTHRKDERNFRGTGQPPPPEFEGGWPGESSSATFDPLSSLGRACTTVAQLFGFSKGESKKK